MGKKLRSATQVEVFRKINWKKIFERYYQLDNQTKEYYNWGTGIGLYYSRRLAEIHHGYIKADNNDEGGATFTFVLPVSKQAYSPEERQPETDAQQNEYIPYPPEKKYKICVCQ